MMDCIPSLEISLSMDLVVILLAIVIAVSLLVGVTILFAWVYKKKGYVSPDVLASKTHPCPVCNKEVSKSAKRCPNCGHDLIGAGNRIINIILIIILAIILIAIVLSQLEFKVTLRIG